MNRLPARPPVPRVPADDPGTPVGALPPSGGDDRRSALGIAAIVLLPIACCGLPVLIAAVGAAGTGLLLGGVAGASLVALGVVVAVLALRRRRTSQHCAAVAVHRDDRTDR